MSGTPRLGAGTSLLRTEPCDDVISAVAELAGDGAIVAITGPAGTGKSVAAWFAAQQTHDYISYVKLAHGEGLDAAVRRLHSAISGGPPAADSYIVVEELRRRVTRDRVRVVLDNVHEAPTEFLDVFCKLWRCARRSGSPLDAALIGSDDAWLAAAPHLRGMLQRWTTTRPLVIEEVVHFIPHLHKIFHNVDPRHLIRVDDAYAHGRWDRWAKFTEYASRHGEPSPESTLAVSEVDWALGRVLNDKADVR